MVTHEQRPHQSLPTASTPTDSTQTATGRTSKRVSTRVSKRTSKRGSKRGSKRTSKRGSKRGTYPQRSSNPSSNPSTIGNHRRLAVPKLSISALLQQRPQPLSRFVHVAWSAFRRSVGTVYLYTGAPLVHALKTGVRTLTKLCIRLLKFVFYPVVVLTRAVRHVTKQTAKLFFTHWKRILAVLFMVLAITVSMDEKRLVEWAGAAATARSTSSTAGSSTLTDVDLQSGVREVGKQVGQHAHGNLQLLGKILSEHLVRPIMTFLAVGLPQLTYEVLRIWHFVLADGASSLLDLMASGLRMAKTMIPGSARGLIRWDMLENPRFAKRLHDARAKDIQSGDPLLKSYLNAQQTLVDRQTQAASALRTAGWTKESREGLDKLWSDILNDAHSTSKGGYQKYIKGEFDTEATTSDTRELTVAEALQQLKRTPMALVASPRRPSVSGTRTRTRTRLWPFGTHKNQNHNSTPRLRGRWKRDNSNNSNARASESRGAVGRWMSTSPTAKLISSTVSGAAKAGHEIMRTVPLPDQSKVRSAYVAGASRVSRTLFNKASPEDITVQNLSHLYFGVVAAGGMSSGIVDGIRATFFQHARTGAVVKLGVKMKAVEEIVPVCFYLDE